jgi:putative salt-induced outer membrane protein YdiY
MFIIGVSVSWILPAHGQDRQLGWAFTTELTGVWTAGNSETRTWGFDATVKYVWDRAEVKINGGAVRSQSTLTTRTAIGTADDFQIVEEKITEKTAENFYARGRYDYTFNPAFFAFGGVDWLRNTFSGIDSRFLIATGAGNVWANTERVKFKTDYSATYTFQEDVVANPFIKTKFPGVRLAYDFFWTLSGTTDFTSVLFGDLNLDNTDDMRADFTNALVIDIIPQLAFKPSHQLLWRNEPSLTEVTLVDSGGIPTGETVVVSLQKLDSIFKMALVVKF